MLKKMRRIVVILLVISLCGGFSVNGDQETETREDPPVIQGISSDGERLIWCDEFNGDKLNWTNRNWENLVGYVGYASRSLHFYSSEYIKVENGKLVMMPTMYWDAEKKQIINDEIQTNQKKCYSSKVWTKNMVHFKYGRIDIRAKLPKGEGTWAGGFMLGQLDASYPVRDLWPNCGEIDIFETTFAKNKWKIPQTIHCIKFNGMSTSTGPKSLTSVVPTATSEYHVYSIEWKDREIKFFIDGKNTWSYNPDKYAANNDETIDSSIWPFYRPFYMVLECKINGVLAVDYGGSPENVSEVNPKGWTKISEKDGIEVYQDYMYVDYIRVYSLPKEKEDVQIAKTKIKLAKRTKKSAIKVKYRKLKNAKKYQIQYASNRKFKKAKIKTTKKRTYIIKNIKKEKSYYIRVRGINGKVKGAWSKVKVVKKQKGKK